MSGELPPLFTVGHSTRTIPQFAELLRCGQVDMVVDVRHIPRSRTNPDYNLDRLPDQLSQWQIGHVQIPELGGLRKRSFDIPADTNGFWKNRSFHNYADYALSDSFEDGLGQLWELSRSRRCAIMCSEALWWRCHRRIIADYLIARGRQVLHLLGTARVEPATITSGAVQHGTKLHYPSPETDAVAEEN